MLLTERPPNTHAAPKALPRHYELRLHGGTEDERLIRVPTGKLTIGTGPRCDLRLKDPGVQPLHCLIVNDEGGLRVRRWAKDTLLNGTPFDEASLEAGDVLSAGSIDLVVCDPDAEMATPTAEVASISSRSPHSQPVIPVVVEQPVQGPRDVASEQARTELPPMSSSEPPVATVENRLTRGRRRKLIGALRFHHELGLQLERAVADLELQMREAFAGQASSSEENAHLSNRVTQITEQLERQRSEHGLFEQQELDRHSQLQVDWHIQFGSWESRLEDLQRILLELRQEVESSQRIRVNVRNRGRRLVKALRPYRDTVRKLVDRITQLEQKTQETLDDRNRLRDEMAAAIELRGTQDTQATAWNAVVEATDRLSANYRHLVAENARLATEIKQFADARDELQAEKAAAAEVLATVQSKFQAQEQRQEEFERLQGQAQDDRQAELERLRGQLQEHLQISAAHSTDFGERADRLERALETLRTASPEPSVSPAEWRSISEEVESVRRQQAEFHRQQTKWEDRVASCEMRQTNRAQQLTDIEQAVEQLRTAQQTPPDRTAELTALSERIASLSRQQAEFERVKANWENRAIDWETRLSDRAQQLGQIEQVVDQLCAAQQERSDPTKYLAALTEQVASLGRRQEEFERVKATWENRAVDWETRLSDRAKQLGEIEKSVEQIRVARHVLPDRTAELATLSEQVASLGRQQAEFERVSSTWETRAADCETQLSDRVTQLGHIESALEQVRAALQSRPDRAAELTTLSDQVAAMIRQQTAVERELEGLRTVHQEQGTQVSELVLLFEQLERLQSQQADFDRLLAEWQNRAADSESQLKDRIRQFDKLESELNELRATQQEQSAAVAQIESREYLAAAQQRVAPSASGAPVEHGNEVADAGDNRQISNSGREAEEDVSLWLPEDMAPMHHEILVDRQPVAERPVDETPADERPTHAPHQPVSYLERYAGMFDEDANGGAENSLAASSTVTDSWRNVANESHVARPVHDEPPAADHDEESVEQYMAKLMQRMRGDGQASSAQSTESSESLDESSDSRTVPEYSGLEKAGLDSGEQSPSNVASNEIEPAGPMFTNVEELKPKTPVREFAADMVALRALANQSARHAIGIHSASRLRRMAVTHFIISVLGVATGLYLLLDASSWLSLRFAAGCVAAVASIYWGQRAFRAFLEAVRVGAVESFDEARGVREPANSLPIDMPR